MSTPESIRHDAQCDKVADAQEADAAFISERCVCNHDASAHKIIEDCDERGPCPWVECSECGFCGAVSQ